jgi:predicted dienelactone hydrolase/ABC-type amino acid transport substrate-binding protein
MINRVTKHSSRIFFGLTSACLITTMGAVVECIAARPSFGAEKIDLSLESPLEVSLSLDSLKTFAETGEITGDLKLFTLVLDDKMMAQLRQGLQRRLDYNVRQTYNLTYSPLGREALEQIGKIVRYSYGRNGFYGLRAALIGAAANSKGEGWTILDAIAQFPATTIKLNVRDLLQLKDTLSVYLEYNRAAVAAIEAQAKTEARSQSDLNLDNLSDLSQPGTYKFTRETLTVNNPALRQTAKGLAVNYDFSVDAYLPQKLSQTAPIVIISHGFGSLKDNFVSIAEHLASYGFIVFVPDHVGSDLSYRENYLQGKLNTLLSPVEFLNRPQEISFLIDRLEELAATDSQWNKLLNLEQIGVMGDSLGAATVLSLAGAELDYARLEETCNQENVIFNLSLYLQCRAQYLPPENFNLGDPRIKAALAAHPLASGIFGPEGMSQIDIPLLITAGSDDLVAPVVTEQIHPFVWVNSKPKYLALFKPGTHFATSEQSAEGAASIPPFLMGKYQEFGRKYFRELNIAFFETYLRDRAEFSPYLSSAYARAASRDKPMSMNIVQSLTPEELKTAYGKKPPIPVVPESVEPKVTKREETILEQIQRTEILKVAMRRDAPPFGYINQEKEWTGYCSDLVVGLQEHLADRLGLDLGIELVELPSTLENRFSLVREDTVHLECGPNTIRQDVEGIAFSRPIWATGTRFLSRKKRRAEINPNLPLDGLQIGVLKNTTSEEFVQTKYPQAEVVYFDGPQGRAEAIKAVTEGSIDTFASDSILSLEEVARQNLSMNNYDLEPTLPLTCDFYGLALPNNDSQWWATVNQFIAKSLAQQVTNKWLDKILTTELNDLEYCLNR